MSDLSITAILSPGDRALIAGDVVAALRPLFEAAKPKSRPPGRRLVDGREMAKIAATSESTLARLVAAGEIPSSKVGASRRFDPDRVLDALAASTDDRRELLLSQLLDVCRDDAERARVREAMGVAS